MRTETEKRLHDALTACKELVELSSGKDYAWYRSERYGRLPETQLAIGLRNRIVHGYDNLDNVIIWDTIRDNIPGLANELKQLLEEKAPL